MNAAVLGISLAAQGPKGCLATGLPIAVYRVFQSDVPDEQSYYGNGQCKQNGKRRNKASAVVGGVRWQGKRVCY